MPQRCGRRRICLGIDRASLRTQLREVALPGGDRRSRCSQGFVVVALLGLGIVATRRTFPEAESYARFGKRPARISQ